MRLRTAATKNQLAQLVVLYVFVLLVPIGAYAQSTVALAGNHSASIPSSWSPAPDSQQINLEAVLALRNTNRLAQLERDLQNRRSPSYHQWLTTDQFVANFGPTLDQMAAVVSWLASGGFSVTSTNLRTRRVEFRGSVETIHQALGTAMVSDGVNYANVSDPIVPEALAPSIQAILGLTRLPPLSPSESSRAIEREVSQAFTDVVSDEVIGELGPNFAPADFYTFYNETPVLNGGNHGTGKPDCVAIPEMGNLVNNALVKFNKQFNLPPVSLKRITVTGMKPGLPSDNEPALDVEWVHALSPNTPIRIYFGTGSTTPYLAAITGAVDDNACGAITSSVEDTCPDMATLNTYNSVVEQAVVQGQTVFKSAGDYGDNWYCGNVIPTAAPIYDQSECQISGASLPSSATGSQPSVDEEAASPFLTSVGGTQFTPLYVNGSDLSLVGDGLETAWNANGDKGDHCPVKDSTGGGKSVVFSKPAWQTGIGVPEDGARDIPDVAIGANGQNAPGFFVYSRTNQESSVNVVATGGTSIATPMWAGISRLIAEAEGVTRLGNINPRLYELGNLQSLSTGLHDVTDGNNTDGKIPGYSAGVGYDQVTGWGSPNIAMLVNAFPGASVPSQVISSDTITRGSSGQVGSFSVTNTTSATLQLIGFTLGVTSPKLYVSWQASATAGAATENATGTPSKQVTLTFASPLAIPSGQTAEITLTATAAKQKGSSALSLILGSVSVSDDGSAIPVGGLPTTLASVTVQ
jgi:subtilase family serine protease